MSLGLSCCVAAGPRFSEVRKANEGRVCGGVSERTYDLRGYSHWFLMPSGADWAVRLWGEDGKMVVGVFGSVYGDWRGAEECAELVDGVLKVLPAVRRI